MSVQRILCILTVLFGLCGTAKAGPPNIVIITADNLGYGDVSWLGNREIKMPHLSRLAKESVALTDFYTASPTCTVSRACLLTGRVAQRHRLLDQLPGLEGNYGVGLRHSETLLPEYLKPLGYTTACFGKWNIGFAEGSRPTERGFDVFFGHASGNIDYETHIYNGTHDVYRGTEHAYASGYASDLWADASVDFIKQHAGRRPFFLYVPFNAPHFPNKKNKAPGQPNIWQAPVKYFRQYGLEPDEPDPVKRYRVVVTALDEAIGRVLEQLDESGIRDETLLVFYSDNGAFKLGREGIDVGSNEPLRAGGVTLYEGGIRVPALVRWPGEIEPGSVCREPLWSCDLVPLAILAAGGTLPKDIVLDGKDPRETLKGQAPSPHEALHFGYRKYLATRKGDYKLIRPRPDAPFELYDLAKDVSESNNLAKDRPAVARELAEDLLRWQASFPK